MAASVCSLCCRHCKLVGSMCNNQAVGLSVMSKDTVFPFQLVPCVTHQLLWLYIPVTLIWREADKPFWSAILSYRYENFNEVCCSFKLLLSQWTTARFVFVSLSEEAWKLLTQSPCMRLTCNFLFFTFMFGPFFFGGPVLNIIRDKMATVCHIMNGGNTFSQWLTAYLWQPYGSMVLLGPLLAHLQQVFQCISSRYVDISALIYRMSCSSWSNGELEQQVIVCLLICVLWIWVFHFISAI